MQTSETRLRTGFFNFYGLSGDASHWIEKTLQLTQALQYHYTYFFTVGIWTTRMLLSFSGQ
jgi:hypothetical protein